MWMKAIWAGILAFFWFILGDKLKKSDQPTQETQDQIVQEAQEQIDEIPKMSDSELDARLADTGLVQPESPGSGGTKGLGKRTGGGSRRPPPTKTHN